MNRVDLKHLAPGMDEELVIEHDADVGRTRFVRACEEDDVSATATRDTRPFVLEVSAIPIARHIRATADLPGLVRRIMDETGTVEPTVQR